MPKSRQQSARPQDTPVSKVPASAAQKSKPSRRKRGGLGPVLRLPAGRFRFPHCPNQHCRFYEPHPDWTFSPWGHYRPPSCPQPLPRFRCRACQRTFTARTFAATYWLHRFDLFGLICKASVAGSAIRQIARTLEVSHSTVARHLSRAARHCLLFHRQMISRTVLEEPILFDGFETFEFSQFFPCHYNLAVGQKSWMIYHFTDSPLRRKGAMSQGQKRRRAQLESRLGRPEAKAVEKGVFELLRTVLQQLCSRPGREAAVRVITLHSDEHPAYKRAVRRLRQAPELPWNQGGGGSPGASEDAPGKAQASPWALQHIRTPSSAPRTRAHALFAVNLADLLLRHCEADHRRQTIAFDKRRQGGLERLALFTVWRNAIKRRREKRAGETAAMRAGIFSRPLEWREVFSRRRFPRERELPGCWGLYYWRRVKTAALGERQTEHRARLAF